MIDTPEEAGKSAKGAKGKKGGKTDAAPAAGSASQTPKSEERKRSQKNELRTKSESEAATAASPAAGLLSPTTAANLATAAAPTPADGEDSNLGLNAAKFPTKKAGEGKNEQRKKSEKTTTELAASPNAGQDFASAGSPTKKAGGDKNEQRKTSEKNSELASATSSTTAGGEGSVATGSPTKKAGDSESKGKKGANKQSADKSAAAAEKPAGNNDDPPKAADPVKTAEASKPEGKIEEPVKIHASGAGGKKIRILAISGSLRKESFNTSLLRAAMKAAPSNVEIVIADITDIPLYNQDTEYEKNPAVEQFKANIESADAILFSTPEYNYSLPGVLKNAIDVASRPWGSNSWAYKPTGLWSVSVSGLGGLRAQMAMRQSAVFLKLNIYPGDEFMVSDANSKFDKNGVSDPALQTKVEKWIAGFSTWVQALPPRS